MAIPKCRQAHMNHAIRKRRIEDDPHPLAIRAELEACTHMNYYCVNDTPGRG
jgi:hypothetical protein